MIKIIRYEEKYKNEWNCLVENSKKGTFLFNRNYMDYHADRFTDFSLLIYRKGKLVAVFPANVKENTIHSHQGLTYGGLIYANGLSAVDVLDIFDNMLDYYRNNQIKNMIYKAIPYVYADYPAQEDLYALFRNHATLMGCNLSSTIPLKKKINFTESRKSGIRKAKNNHLSCECSDNFETFWHILNTNLGGKYDVKPVHSLEEILYLQRLFPKNIKLYLAKKESVVLAGTILYIHKNMVHAQYISANQEGKESGALDLLLDYLINQEYSSYEYFDFGQSTEQMGSYLNENLLFQKEGFGGRGVVYNIYELTLCLG